MAIAAVSAELLMNWASFTVIDRDVQRCRRRSRCQAAVVPEKPPEMVAAAADMPPPRRRCVAMKCVQSVSTEPGSKHGAARQSVLQALLKTAVTAMTSSFGLNTAPLSLSAVLLSTGHAVEREQIQRAVGADPLSTPGLPWNAPPPIMAALATSTRRRRSVRRGCHPPTPVMVRAPVAKSAALANCRRHNRWSGRGRRWR